MTELVIDVAGINKSFAGISAVKSLELKVPRGAIYGFLGPNGSGKTTSIRMLCGLLTPDSGSGTCLGLDVVKDSAKIKTQVGYMTQHFSLFKDLTVRENLVFVAKCYGVHQPTAAVADMLQQLDLTPRQHQLSGTLSGGWKQRLALAASLIHRPKLLLLDEPTAGVDPKSRRDFWAVLAELSQQGVTTLVSTHYMDEAARCTELAYMINGVLKTSGTCDAIIEQSGLCNFVLSGKGVIELMPALSQIEGCSQVARFGHHVHVVGHHAEKLAKTLKNILPKSIKMQQSQPSIEDVFIDFVNTHPKGGSA